MPKRLTQEEFESKVLEKIGSDYKVLGKYINRDTKILMKHYVCSNEFMKRPHDIISKGSGCPFCNGNQNAKYNEKWVIEHTPLPYKYISGYKNMTTKCKFYCEKCDTSFEQMPARLINQKIYGCNCCKNKKKSHEDFLQELGKVCLEEYEVLDKYINVDTKIHFKHKKCGSIFEITPWYFIHKANKKYCPICYYKKSRGEIIINKFLEENDINYQREFSFPNSKKRFDFYLPDLNICIEYDGEQHFKAINFFGGEKGLIDTQKRDKEKNQYCLKNNIQLFRIPYTDLTKINQILNEILKEKSSTTIEKYLVTE